MRYSLLLLLLSIVSYSQQKHTGITLDQETKEPLEFVSVYNSEDHTLSNADGRFTFSSKKDSVIFYRVGYDKIKTTFSALKDTILLNKSVLELNEVVVTNAKSTLEKLRDSVAKNYELQPYKEKFLLRAIAKKDNELWRIQDIQGKLKSQTLFYTKEIQANKKDFQVELTNMRKLGAVSDENNAYLKFPSFHQILTSYISVGITDSLYNFKESYFDNKRKIKLEYTSKNNTKRKSYGYYIIDTNSYAVENYYHKVNHINKPYKKNWHLKYRDTFYEMKVVFKQNKQNSKYYISSAKTINKIETTNEKKTFNVEYELTSIYTTSDNFGNFEVNKNVSSNKDLFKLKHPYNSEYWQSQNQLLLTEEMEDFITKMGKENAEFKVKSNMD